MRSCPLLISCVFLLVPDARVAEREQLVREFIEGQGIHNRSVVQAMRQTHRHEFMPENVRRYAYEDRPLPIGFQQTISQPSLVAFMTDRLDVHRSHRVLEIGTGSGYQAAVLAALAKEVYSVEIVRELAMSSADTLKRLGYTNVFIREGNGYFGWPRYAPFDRIILTAAPPELPQALVDQLKPGGKLIAPVGPRWDRQELLLLEKSERGEVSKRWILPVRFVPMVQQPVVK